MDGIGNYLVGPHIIHGTLNGDKYLHLMQEHFNLLIEEALLYILKNNNYI